MVQSAKSAYRGFLLFTLVTVQRLWADISVAPVALFLDDDARNGRVYIQNTGNLSKDVEVTIRFGYPLSDERGNVLFQFMETPDANEPSATSWVKAFPDRFTLEAGSAQVIVLMATPPAVLPDGEYWARPVLTFRTSTPNASEHAIDESQIVLSLYYRHGVVTTGIVLRDVKLERAAPKTNVILELQRSGNAAFLGSIVCRLKDHRGTVVDAETVEVAVYRNLKRCISLADSIVPAASYILEVELNTSRRGFNEGEILSASPVIERREVPIGKHPVGNAGEVPPGRSIPGRFSFKQTSNQPLPTWVNFTKEGR